MNFYLVSRRCRTMMIALLLLILRAGAAETSLDQLRASAKFTFVQLHPGQLALQVTEASQSVAIHIPAGTWLKPVAGMKAPTYLVWKTADFVVQPGPGLVNHALGVVLANIDQWDQPVSNAQWEAFPPERSLAQEQLGRFFKVAALETNLAWAGAQIGAAVILQDIRVARLYDKSLTMRGPAGEITRHLYSYAAILQVRALFEKAGLRPILFHLFADNDENLEMVLKAHTVNSWNDELLIPHTGNLFSGLIGYAASPRVRELLLAYAQHHPNEYHVWQAALALVEINGLTGTNDELFQQITTDPNRLLRFAAAATLAQRQDWRALPLVAAFSHDQMLIGPLENDWNALVTRQSTLQRRPRETLLEFWERAGGWERLAIEHDVAALKAAVAKLRAQEEADLDARLLKTSAAKGQDLATELATVPRRFPRHPKVVAWVGQIAATQPDPKLRVAAILALRDLELFDHYDLLVDRLDNDPAAKVRIAAVSTLWSPDPSRRTEFFLRAIRHPDPQVRLAAIRQLDKDAFTPAVNAPLALLARTGSTTDLRVQALTKLVQFGATNTAALARETITTSDPRQTDFVVAAVRLWTQVQPDADGLAFLQQTATRHALVKARAAALDHLDAYRRQKLPVLAIALDCITQDADESVQMSALALAHRQLTRGSEKEIAAQVIAAGLNSKLAGVRARAVNIVAEQQLTALEPRVVEIAKTETDMKAREAAYAALQKLKSAALVEVLAVWTRAENPGPRRAALQHLRREFAHHPRTRMLIEPLARDREDDIKRDAARFLNSPQ